MAVRSAVSAPSKTYHPSDWAAIGVSVAQWIEQLRDHFRNMIDGIFAAAPTTASTQATGAGNTEWRVNLSEGNSLVAGVLKEFAVQADYAIHSGSLYTGLTSGKSAVATIVAKNVSGTVTLAVVKGAAATTGGQVAPTDAEITAAVGAGNEWVKLAECTLNRTGDTSVTQSQDSTKRPYLGVTQDSGFGDL